MTKGSPEGADLTFFSVPLLRGPRHVPRGAHQVLQGQGCHHRGRHRSYKEESTSLPFAIAGSHMIPTAYPSCSLAQHWCRAITGSSTCTTRFDGHLEVKESSTYRMKHEAKSGRDEWIFNTFGDGHELKPQLKVTAGGELVISKDISC